MFLNTVLKLSFLFLLFFSNNIYAEDKKNPFIDNENISASTNIPNDYKEYFQDASQTYKINIEKLINRATKTNFHPYSVSFDSGEIKKFKSIEEAIKALKDYKGKNVSIGIMLLETKWIKDAKNKFNIDPAYFLDPKYSIYFTAWAMKMEEMSKDIAMDKKEGEYIDEQYIPGMVPKEYRKFYVDAAKFYNVPLDALISISYVESGFKPYIINFGGQDKNFKTKEEAINAIRNYKGSSYDVGIMQINSYWFAKKHNIDPAHFLDPKYCIMFGAWVLRDCFDRYGQDWKSIASYHIPPQRNPGRASWYTEMVLGAYKKIYNNKENKQVALNQKK